MLGATTVSGRFALSGYTPLGRVPYRGGVPTATPSRRACAAASRLLTTTEKMLRAAEAVRRALQELEAADRPMKRSAHQDEAAVATEGRAPP